jgi:hypothetical protein
MSGIPTIEEMLGPQEPPSRTSAGSYEADLERRMAQRAEYRADLSGGDTDPLLIAMQNEAAARRAAMGPTLGNPDAAGRANVLGRSTGLPPMIVQPNLDRFEAMARASKTNELARKFPAYGR